ncbi:OmpA family protein [Paucihalobacter sp.]|uniref:OmpA family protein n=1 Tax=Paucihalobacter sp. TaxID=2850405 RepID=UPI003D1613B8
MNLKLITLCFALSTVFGFSQKKLADKFFSNYGYVKATELYQEAVAKGDSSAHVLTRLGDCYYNNSDTKNAALWYGKALKKYKDVHPEYIYKYIQALRSVGNYDEADVWTKTFQSIQTSDTRIKGYNPDEVDILEKFAANTEKVVNIEGVPFNTANSDFGSYINNGKLYFASSKADENNKVYSWNKEPFLDIFEVSVSEENGKTKFGTPDFINAEKLNTDYHEATVAITNDGKTLYFTRDNVTKRNKLDYDKKGTSHLKIYKATLSDDGTWDNIKELPFNDAKSSTGHPALSPDNKKLYFVSDREGGFGQTDIYEVDILEDGTYGEPMNLGPNVNTESREMFPFVSKDNTLYFSTDGFLNLGLLDIFKSNILKESDAQPENLGAPYNSGYDDFAFFLDEETSKGYFSSNRPGGLGSDDIYQFNSYVCSQIIKGIARDVKTNAVLPGVEVRLIDNNGKVIEKLTTTEEGTYEFEVDCNQIYTVVGSKDDYKEDQTVVKTDDNNGKVIEADLYLTPLIMDNQIVINPIFFDFDKWNIRTDAEYELENIVDVLRKHPTMVIKIESHTDSRGSDSYNMKLSDRRAKSTRDYLLSRGIAPERIESAIGYGETQLLNKCSNGVRCSAEEHQLNRRSYFYILKE